VSSRGGACPKVLILTAFVDSPTLRHPLGKGPAIALISHAPKSTTDKVHTQVSGVI